MHFGRSWPKAQRQASPGPWDRISSRELALKGLDKVALPIQGESGLDRVPSALLVFAPSVRTRRCTPKCITGFRLNLNLNLTLTLTLNHWD